MFVFRQERENGDVIEHKIASDEVLLSEVLEQFEYFLKGCSYVFDGHVDIINEEETITLSDSHPVTAGMLSDNIDLYDTGNEIIFDSSPMDDVDSMFLSGDTITLDLTDTYGATTTKLKDD